MRSLATERTALLPGSFDPPTFGHLDVIERVVPLFDHVIVAVAVNTAKDPIFSLSERVEILRALVPPSVQVEQFEGLLIDHIRSKQVNGTITVVRGIRSVSDFEYELQIAHANHVMDAQFETLFMMTRREFGFIRSSIIKELIRFGGDISRMVPPPVATALRRKLGKSTA